MQHLIFYVVGTKTHQNQVNDRIADHPKLKCSEGPMCLSRIHEKVHSRVHDRNEIELHFQEDDQSKTTIQIVQRATN